MVGKMILPLLGGSPAVWNTCMMFFQAGLLAGYIYAHATSAWLGPRLQAGLHLGVLLLPLLVLPVAFGREVPAADAQSPVGWLLWQLLVIVGPPLFVIAATAPLLQKWFAQTHHAGAKDPYFLYAASNLGSLAALASYPLLIERFLGLPDQSRLWTGGYLLLIGMIAACAAAMWRSVPRQRAQNRTPAEGAFPPSSVPVAEVKSVPAAAAGAARPEPDGSSGDPQFATGNYWSRRLRWLLLAMVPSSLMLGVTAHLTTNVAAMPLLWVIPLGVYLLTFVLVFARRPPLSHALMNRLLPWMVLLVAPFFFITIPELEWRTMLVHLAVFFIAAMVCHGELARDRPHPRHLTEYYLWIAVGGVCGGIFNALVAPQVFTDVLEYPLMLCAALLLRPRQAGTGAQPPQVRWLDFGLPAVLAAAAVGLVFAIQITEWRGTWGGLMAVMVVVAVACLAFRHRPLRFGLGYAAGLAALVLYARLEEGNRLHVERNFFGISRVVMDSSGSLHMLYHGTTLHGMQRTGDGSQPGVPLAYYHPRGAIGEAVQAVLGKSDGQRIGVIGLGSGSVAAYSRPGQHIVFHEIDPAVVRIAEDPRYFSFLQESPATYEIRLGDGRLTLATMPDGHYDLILLDAYSSDAIPTHLLSREALAVYLSKLADRGVMVFHISNRFMDLEPVLGNLARDAGLVCLARPELENRLTPDDYVAGALPAHVVVMARRIEDLHPLAGPGGWRPTRTDGRAVWTDQYSGLMELLLARGKSSPPSD